MIIIDWEREETQSEEGACLGFLPRQDLLGQRPWADPFLSIHFLCCPFSADNAAICIMLSASKALRRMKDALRRVASRTGCSHASSRGNVLSIWYGRMTRRPANRFTIVPHVLFLLLLLLCVIVSQRWTSHLNLNLSLISSQALSGSG